MNLRKRWRVFSALFMVSILCFTSCDNFLQGTDVKEEITKSIEYNNAPSYAINVEALAGTGTIKTPATGEVTKKVTDTFTIRFEPAENHKFIKWEAVVKGMSTGEKAADYITFEDSESLETKVTFKKASSKTIVLRPVCPENISVKSFNLGESDIAYPKDSSIILIFNKPIAEDCIDSISVSIPGIDEGKDFKDYFKAPKLISEKEVAIYADWDREDGPNYIPVPTNGTKTISITIPKNKLYYICKDYLEPYKITLNTDLTFTYTISDETSEQTHIKFLVDEDTKGTFRVNDENANELISKYSVGKSLNLRYKPAEGYFFDKWVIKRTYNENGVNKIDIIPLDKLDTISLSFTYPENEENFGVDPLTNVVQAVLTIVNYTSGDITVTPVNKPRQKIQFKQVDDQFGTYKIDDVLCDNQLHEYSIGSSVNLKFKVNDGYRYRGWKVYKIVPNQQGNEGLEELDSNTYSDYLTFTFDDNTVEGYAEETKLATVQLDIKASYNNTLVVKPDVIPIPTAIVTIEGANGKFSPSKGETTVLQGASIHQMFEPDGDYEFIKWEILDANKNCAAVDNGSYISIEDTKKNDINYTLTTAPTEDENIAIVLRPKVLERPQIISNTPLYDSSGTYRDVSIMVMFDSDMDERSIYYTDDEVAALKTQYNLVDDEKTGVESDFLKTKEGRIYGYRRPEGNSKIPVFKNIQITNNRTGEVLTKYFDAPIFTDKRTLLIPANKENPVPASTTVLVVLSKDFYFTESDIQKPVSMREAKKWIYFVNSSTDNVAPSVQIGLANWRRNEIGRISNDRKIINGALDLMLNVTVSENASGIPELFTMNLIDANTNEIVRTYDIPYSTNSKNYADYAEKENGQSTLTYKAFNLNTGYIDETGTLLPGVEPLADGDYNISFVFKDKNENVTTALQDKNNSSETADSQLLPFCITLDTTVPVISNYTLDVPQKPVDGFYDFGQGEINFKWTCEDSDYTKAIINYKKSSESAWSSAEPILKSTETSYSKTISGLADSTSYDFKIEFYDENDNIYIKEFSNKRTVPVKIAADTLRTEITGAANDKIKVTWKKPNDPNYTTAYIFVYKDFDDAKENNSFPSDNYGKVETVETTSEIEPGEDETYTITGLDSATDYCVIIYAADVEKGLLSSRTKSSSHVYTAPVANKAYIDDITPENIMLYLKQEDYKDGVTVNIYKGAVYTGDDTSVQTIDIDDNNKNILFEDTPVKTITKKEDCWTDGSSTALTPGEKYYYKIVPQYHGTLGVPCYLVERTQTAAVTNLHVIDNEVTTSSVKISWDKAAGVFKSYSVTVNGETALVPESQNSEEHPSYVIDGLEGGKSYSYSVRTNAFEDGWESESPSENVTTAPNPVPAFTIAKGTGKITVNYTKPQNNYDTIEWWLSPAENGVDTDNYTKQTATAYSSTSVDITLPEGEEFFIKAKTKYNGRENDSSPLYFTSATCIVSNIRVTAVTNDSISIAWDNPENGYKSIEILNSSGNVIDTLGKTATSWKKESLDEATRYYYRIRLVPDQEGVTAAAVSTPYIYTNPNKVTDVTTAKVSGYKDRITITYHKPVGWYGGIQLIDTSTNSVIAAYSGSSSYNNDTAAVSITCTGFKPGQQRTFKFRTLPKGSYGSYCDTEEFSQYTYAPVVTNVSASITTTTMTVNWTLPGEGVWSGFRVWYYNQTTGNTSGNYVDAASSSSTSCKIPVTAGNYYKYYVTTLSQYNNNSSNTGDYYLRAQPAAVTNLKCASADKTANSLYVTWTKPTGYYDYLYVYYKKSSDSSYTQAAKITSTSTTSCTISGLAADTSYDIKVKTNIQDNTSANYNNEATITSVWTKPLPCSNIQVIGNAGAVKVSWTRPSSTYYRAYIYSQIWNGSSWGNETFQNWMGTNEANSYTIPSSKITKDKKYRFVVKNYSSNSGEFSVSIIKDFYSAPPTPSNLSVWSHDGSGYHTIRFWMPGTTTVQNLNVNVFIDGSYDSCTSFTNTSSGTYVYYKLSSTKIDKYSNHSVYLRVYNTENSGREEQNGYQVWDNETYAETYGIDSLSFNTNIILDGTVCYYSTFKNVNSTNKTITGSGSSGAFTSGRTVTLTPYSMGKYEVTEAFYNKVMGLSSGAAYKPKVNVNFYQAITFCNRLSIKLGLQPVYKVKKNNSTYYTNDEWLTVTPPTSDSTVGYWRSVETDLTKNGFHLPTECQWEFAARGGDTSAAAWNYTYSGSNTLTNVGWYDGNSGSAIQDSAKKTSNSLGIYGMSGNAAELTNDFYVSAVSSLPSGSLTDPVVAYSWGPATSAVTARGGSYVNTETFCRTTYRNSYSDYVTGYTGVGFRICRQGNYTTQ